jgi:predicted metal-dependent HD superfamily phosphohydrolase
MAVIELGREVREALGRGRQSMSDHGLRVLARLWGELGATVVNGGLFNQLVAAYSEPHRHYHTLQHLREGLAHFDAGDARAAAGRSGTGAVVPRRRLRPARSDNEERSAHWARAACWPPAARPTWPTACGAGARHQAATRAGDDPDTQLLLDIDLAILGSAPARFDEYERQVRAEYAASSRRSRPAPRSSTTAARASGSRARWCRSASRPRAPGCGRTRPGRRSLGAMSVIALDWMSDSRIGVRPTMVFFSDVVLAVMNCAYSQAAAVRLASWPRRRSTSRRPGSRSACPASSTGRSGRAPCATSACRRH